MANVKYLTEAPYTGDSARMLFCESSTDDTANFTVRNRPVILRVHDLATCDDGEPDCICVNQRLVTCCGDSELVSPLMFDGCRQCLDCCNNTLIVPFQGSYQLERRCDAPGTIITIDELDANFSINEATKQWL